MRPQAQPRLRAQLLCQWAHSRCFLPSSDADLAIADADVDMDPFSVTAGAGGLIAVCGAALSKCYTYGSGVAAAPREAKALEANIKDLSGVLVGLQSVERLTMTEEKKDRFSNLLRNCKADLVELDRTLVANAPKDTQSKAERTFKRFKWPLDEKKTATLVQMVEQQKPTLNVALSDLTVYDAHAREGLQSDSALGTS